MKGAFIGLLALVFIVWLITWVLSHSFLIVSVGPIIVVLVAAFILLFVYLKHYLGRKKA